MGEGFGDGLGEGFGDGMFEGLGEGLGAGVLAFAGSTCLDQSSPITFPVMVGRIVEYWGISTALCHRHVSTNDMQSAINSGQSFFRGLARTQLGRSSPAGLYWQT